MVTSTATTTTTGTTATTTTMHPLNSTTTTASNSGVPGVQLPSTDSNDIGKYGLRGLSSLVRMEQSDFTNYALGQDIGKCGLDLSPDVEILKTWASPWSETTRSDVEPYFTIPIEMQNKTLAAKDKSPDPINTKIQNLTDETLFYIFYMKPRDTLQEHAARELVARNWRYHKDIQVWLTKDSNVEPVLIGQDVEKGVYIFFDPHNWEKIRKEFVLYYSSVQA